MKMKILCAAMLLYALTLRADGVIVIPRPPRPGYASTPYPLEIKYHRVETRIKDFVASTSVSQEFYNPTPSRLEGIYIFPLPPGAAIKGFSMEINGKEVHAELLDAEKARKIYSDIVRDMKDPALLEYAGRNAFKASIFPIEPRSTKKVKIEYSEVLERDAEITKYVYPLNTEKFSAKPVENVSISIDIVTGRELRMIFSPSHSASIKKTDAYHAKVVFEGKNVLPDTDFSLYFSTRGKGIGADLITHEEDGEDGGFFLLNISPSGNAGDKEILRKNIIFAIDASGSMSGEKMEQAKKALNYSIENLNRKDRFEVIRFSTEAEKLFGSLQAAEPGRITEAKHFISAMEPMGGTNIGEALSMALSAASRKGEETTTAVVFITDGKPTVGKTDENELAELVRDENKKMARIFVFGIDYAINTHLLDRIAEESAGYRTYVAPGENIEAELSSFYEKIRFPVFTELKADFKNMEVNSVYPKRLPDLFKNSQILITGRYKKGGRGKVVLEGRMGGDARKLEYMLDFRDDSGGVNDFIPRIWAARHTGYLLDSIRLNGESKELRDEIIRVARRYGIITPYTSFLILEDEEKSKIAAGGKPGAMPLRNNVAADGSFYKKIEQEYGNIHEKHGQASIQASREILALRNARNREEINQGGERLVYKSASGRKETLESRVRNVQGRAVYLSNNRWTDSRAANAPGEKVKRIRFASEEYFNLLEKEPLSAQFLALGKNVRFAIKDGIYEIYE